MGFIKIAFIGAAAYFLIKKFADDSNRRDVNRLPSGIEIQNELQDVSKDQAAQMWNITRRNGGGLVTSLNGEAKLKLKNIFKNIAFASILDTEFKKLSGKTTSDAMALFSGTELDEISRILQGLSKFGVFAIDSQNGAPAECFSSNNGQMIKKRTLKGKTYIGRLVSKSANYVSVIDNDGTGNLIYIPVNNAYLVEIKN